MDRIGLGSVSREQMSGVANVGGRQMSYILRRRSED